MSQHRQTYLSGPDVSRETLERLSIYEALLKKWQNVKNLVSPSTLDDIWHRHFSDSLQLLRICPDARRWVDIGTGAGFPGMVIAIALGEIADSNVYLIESDNRKCAFLREVARETGAKVTVLYGRAEKILPTLEAVEVVTARAVTSLNKLVDMAMPLLEKGAVGLFPKGRDHLAELTQLHLPSNFTIETVPSLTGEQAAIVIVRGSRLDLSASAS